MLKTPSIKSAAIHKFTQTNNSENMENNMYYIVFGINGEGAPKLLARNFELPIRNLQENGTKLVVSPEHFIAAPIEVMGRSPRIQ
jgi:hypothetical protein